MAQTAPFCDMQMMNVVVHHSRVHRSPAIERDALPAPMLETIDLVIRQPMGRR